MNVIVDDLKQIEQDVEKIQCNPILVFLSDCLKCIKDSVSYFFGVKS